MAAATLNSDVVVIILFLSVVAESGVQCGKRPLIRRIIGGIEATPHSWPWQCAIMIVDRFLKCGCSVINEEWVVTAAHCRCVALSNNNN